MTYQEAINAINAIIFCAKANPQHCLSVGDCWNCQGHVPAEEDMDAYNMAIEALEKQIAKKVEIGEDTYAYCGSCGYPLSAYFYKAKFCHGCGRKLDWSDVE